jgi:drug/metabolite transporter (DMT)-like permease
MARPSHTPDGSAARRAPVATGGALIGFAANSLLCRAALGAGSIDAWSFTAVRLGAGALTLALLTRAVSGQSARGAGSAGSALALWAYAAAFSLAYLRLSTGVGALVLFGAVQATMIGWGLVRGARASALEWVGLAVALGGLVVLTLPGASTPDADRLGLALMALAGIAWGVYSLRGRSNRSPIAATSDNFALSVPLALGALLFGILFAELHASTRGVLLALASGALASGLGYCLWYTALPFLSAMRAALVQLLVPVLAAVAGIVVLDERPTVRLAIAAPLILCGVACAVLGRARQRARPAPAPAAAPTVDRRG